MTRDQRTGLDVLGYDECVELLARAPVGRVAVNLAGHSPVIFPVNYTFDGHNVAFRTDTSSLLHRAHQHAVAFEIDGIDRRYHLGWSVLVVGIVEEVTDRTELAALTTMPLGPWAPGLKSHWMRIRPDTITGRSIPALQETTNDPPTS
jgi:nitroimidazol reductase NimA-like FMN-containing flavoprotein (pyridoxamine 5'-phosphate oxidase superfamily)